MQETPHFKEVTQRKEDLTAKREIIFLPKCREEDIDFSRVVWPHFSYDTFQRNLQIVEQIVDRNDYGNMTKELICLIEEFRSVVRWLREKNSRFKNLEAASPIIDTLSGCLPEIEKVTEDGISVGRLAHLIGERLSVSDGNLVFLSSSHVTFYSEISALKEVVPEARTGIVVFDRHADFYATKSEIDKGLDQLDLGKRNFFLFLIKNSLIDGVAFVGFPKDNRVEVVEKRQIQNLTFFGMKVFYKDHRDSISIADEGAYLKKEDRAKAGFDMEAFVSEIKRQIEFLRRSGATHVVISVDPDVLMSEEFGYTAVEYNQMTYALNLGVKDFSTAQLAADIEIGEADHLRKGVDPKVKKSLKDQRILESLKTLDFLRQDLRGIVTGLPKPIIGYGLPLGAIGRAIDTIKTESVRLGMQYGVPLPMGGRYFGDVTELSAPDFKGRTARAVKGIIARISG